MGKKKIRNRAFEKMHENGDHKEDKKCPKGLINVGNTCYFNSTLQCVSRVRGLQNWIKHLSSDGSVGYLKRSSIDGDTQTLRLLLPKLDAQFSRNFISFTEELLGASNTRSSVTPEDLRKAFVINYKQFNNDGQHDSHEALRCFLERLKLDEIRIWQRAILNEKKFTSSASEELKEDIKSWGQSTDISTTVDRIFGGVLMTSIQCCVCKNTSIIFGTFLDLSVPVCIDNSEQDPYLLNINFGQKHKIYFWNSEDVDKDYVSCHSSFFVTCSDSGNLVTDGDSVQKMIKEVSIYLDASKKGKKGKRYLGKDAYDLESDCKTNQFDGDQGQTHSWVNDNTGRKNTKYRKGYGKRSTKKNKYGKKRWLESSDSDGDDEDKEVNEQQCEPDQEQEENEPVDGVEEQQEEDGEECQNGADEFDLFGIDAKEGAEEEKTFLSNSAAPNDDSDSDNASLELNHGSISDFRDSMVDDFDGHDSNKSTGSPESVLDFDEEEGGESQDEEAAQKGDEEKNCSPLSSIEGEKKSLASTSTGDAADMEDNADDADGMSTISVPGTALDDGAFCEEFIAKSRLVDAGNTTPIAQPEESNWVKKLSTQAILVPQGGKDALLTDLESYLMNFFKAEELKDGNRIGCDKCTKKAQSAAGEVDDCRSNAGKDGRVFCDSLKRDLLLKPPAVLTIHLKRYRNGVQLRKCNKHISFPINLDIRPYCSRLAWLGAEEGQYRLFGIVQHSGSMNSGHYVAYVAENTDGDIPADCFIPTLERPFPWPLNLHHLVYQFRRGDQRVLNGDPGAANLSDREDNRTWHYFSDTSVRQVPLSEVLKANPYLLFYQRVK